MRKKKAPGPEADRLKLHGNWKALVGKAMEKQKPKDGWPVTTVDNKRKTREKS